MTAVFLLGFFGLFALQAGSTAWAFCVLLVILGSVGLGTGRQRG